MELTLLFVYALPVVTLLALGLLGKTRRLGFWWTLLLSIVLTPLGGFIAAQISGPRQANRRAG